MLEACQEHELASQPDLDKEIVEKRWNQLHRKNAKLVHQHILKYRGFLTKFGGLVAIGCNWIGQRPMNSLFSHPFVSFEFLGIETFVGNQTPHTHKIHTVNISQSYYIYTYLDPQKATCNPNVVISMVLPYL